MKLNYKSIGKGKPVIIAHGLFGSLDNWMTIGKAMADFFEVFLVDMRNHGRSPHSAEMNYMSMAEDLNRFILEHSLEETALIGHSMGGKAAMQMAFSFPEAIEKLVVIDIGIKAYEPRHDHILKGLYALNFDKIRSRAQAETELANYINDPGVRLFLLKGLYRKDSKSFGLRYNLSGIAENIGQIGNPVTGDTTLIPTLFIRGEQSDYIEDQDIPELEEHFPNSTLISVQNAGHWVHADQPNELLNTLLAFLIYN